MTQWLSVCPSVRPSVCAVNIITVTYQRAACDAASVHFYSTIRCTDMLVWQRSIAVVRTAFPTCRRWNIRTSDVVIRRGTIVTCAGASATRRCATACRSRRCLVDATCPSTVSYSRRRRRRPSADRPPSRCPPRPRRTRTTAAGPCRSPTTTPRPGSTSRGIWNRFLTTDRTCGTPTTNHLVRTLTQDDPN